MQENLSCALIQGIDYGAALKNVDVLGLSCCEDHPREICGTLSLKAEHELCLPDGSLRYDQQGFLSLKPTPFLIETAFMAGIAIGAASQSKLVLSDDRASVIAMKYALMLAPDIKPYLMFVCPDYLDLNITTSGGCVCALGMKLIDASLQMLKDMKTFAEAKVAVANDGPGADIQVEA